MRIPCALRYNIFAITVDCVSQTIALVKTCLQKSVVV